MKSKLFAFVATAALALAACNTTDEPTTSPTTDSTDSDTLSIYTTVYPIEYFTQRIGGDAVSVSSIYPPGSDEHTFEPTQKDMMEMADADYLFSIGLGLEGFISSAEQTLANQSVEIVKLADAISDDQLIAGEPHDHGTEETHDEEEHAHEEEGHAHDEEEHAHDEEESSHEEEGHEGHDHGELDPHIWISPSISIEIARAIEQKLTEAAPENQELFEANFNELEAELLELDRAFTDMAEQANRDTFFVSHAAFGYWADAYNLNQVAVAGLNSQDEPSQRELASLVDQAREQQIEYILTEQNVSSKLTEIIRSEVGAETLELHNLGVLTQDNIDNQETYFTLMEQNLEALRTALQ